MKTRILIFRNFSDTALISEQQNDLSITGAIPFASGPAIRNTILLFPPR